MSKRTRFIMLGIAVAAVVGWAVFRPELLFISKCVDESFPGSNGASAQTLLASGNFYGVAHETKGMADIYRLADGKRVVRFTKFETSNGPGNRAKLPKAMSSSCPTVRRTGLKKSMARSNYYVVKVVS